MIKEYDAHFFDRVREIIGRASHTSEAAKIINKAEADVQATLRRLYAEGIGAAMRNSAQTATETKNAATEGGEKVYCSRDNLFDHLARAAPERRPQRNLPGRRL